MTKKMTMLGVGPKLVRIFLPYLLLTLALTLLYPSIFVFASGSWAFTAIGILLILIGLALWASGARMISKAFGEGRLVTKGAFGIVRHPMYSGLIIFVSTGLAIYFRSWIMLTVALVGYFAFKMMIKDEEDYLKESFGQEYADYKARVNALVPFPRFKS